MTVVIPTLNEADRLAGCLVSVGWAAQVVVVDGGSTDGTVALARAAGATVVEGRFATIAQQRNAGAGLATQPWVLALDADERVDRALSEAIFDALVEPAHDAYRLRYRNWYLGRVLSRGHWGRDAHVRLYRAGYAYRVQRVHEGLEGPTRIGELDGRVEHESYRDLRHHMEKSVRYAAWGAADARDRGRRVRMRDLVLGPAWRFVQHFVLQGMWREGTRGFIESAMHAWSGFAKYALLWDLERQGDAARAIAPAAPTDEASMPDRAALPLAPRAAAAGGRRLRSTQQA